MANNEERYREMATKLKDDYKDNYFSTQSYVDENDGFLAPVLPLEGIDKFFGPRVLTILILSKNYGWKEDEFTWPPEKLAEQILRVKELYAKWSEYKVHIYLDKSQFDPEQMDMVEASVIEMCHDLKDYGYTYKGELPDEADETFFKQELDLFYGKEQES
jgi:hypothetical protein